MQQVIADIKNERKLEQNNSSFMQAVNPALLEIEKVFNPSEETEEKVPMFI